MIHRSAQCPQCGCRTQSEEVVRDYFDPANPYGHGQQIEIQQICTNHECDFVGVNQLQFA